jgi:hypothetical protein
MKRRRMGTARASRSLILRVCALSAIAGLCFSLAIRPHRARYRHRVQRQEELLAHRAGLMERRRNLENYLDRFSSEESFRQRVVRERLGYVGGDEFVYIFEE